MKRVRLWAGGLRFEQFATTAVGPIRLQADLGPRRAGDIGAGGESTGDELVTIVESGSRSMHGADETPWTSADHRHPQPAPQHLDHRVVRHPSSSATMSHLPKAPWLNTKVVAKSSLSRLCSSPAAS